MLYYAKYWCPLRRWMDGVEEEDLGSAGGEEAATLTPTSVQTNSQFQGADAYLRSKDSIN